MPNRHTTLTSLFTDIAGAIRSKTGDSAEIKADDFDTAIEAIPTGGSGGGEFTTEQLLGVDPIDSLSYDGTTLPKYALCHRTINNISLPNLTTINDGSLSYVNTHSNLNTLFSKLETINTSGLQYFNENIILTSNYDIVFPKLVNVDSSSFDNFAGTYSEYDYHNYNNPKYNIIMPLVTTSSTNYYSILRYQRAVRNFSARNLMCSKNICFYGYSIGTIDIKGWTTAPTSSNGNGCLISSGYNLRTLVIRNSTMCPASSNPAYMWGKGSSQAFFMTGTVDYTYNPNGEHGVIYVPDDLVDTYKNDANWQACFDVNYIKPLSEYVDPYESYYQQA